MCVVSAVLYSSYSTSGGRNYSEDFDYDSQNLTKFFSPAVFHRFWFYFWDFGASPALFSSLFRFFSRAHATSNHLPLEFRPDHSIFTGLCQPITKPPDGRKIWDTLWKAEEFHEREPIRDLPLKFWIGEPVPLLEHQQFDHQHFIDIRSLASFALVIVQLAHYRTERFPIKQRFNLRKFIVEPRHSLVRFIQAKIKKNFPCL